MAYTYDSSPAEASVMQELLARYPSLTSRAELHKILQERTALDVDDALERFFRAGVVHRIGFSREVREPDDLYVCSYAAVVTEESATADCPSFKSFERAAAEAGVELERGADDADAHLRD